MRIDGLMSEEQIFVNGRGAVRLLDLMEEAGIPHTDVGFPFRRYHKFGGVILVCRKDDRPYERIELAIPDRHFAPDSASRVVNREPIPYVELYGELFEYEKGTLSLWSQRRKKKVDPLFPSGHILFEVLGRTDDQEHLRVKLPHKAGEWRVHHRLARWMNRLPSPLELRLQELWIEDPFKPDYQHPLSSGGHFLEHARVERTLLSTDGRPFTVLAVEEWEDLRNQIGLSVDEAIVAISDGLLSDLENRGTTYYSGPFETSALERYRKGAWSQRDGKSVLEQMGILHTVEFEMLRGAMRAVASTRQLYARDAFDKMMGK